MKKEFEYYYNNVPGKGLCRNNLIYTSLMSTDKTEFVQWYYNDTKYHQGHNQVIDPHLMNEKWRREVKYLTMFNELYPQYTPYINNIDEEEKKIYLKVNGPDFWEKAGCNKENFDKVVPDWKEQIIEIQRALRKCGLYKYSQHPSSYFVDENNKLKTFNFFFVYENDEPRTTIKDHLSHISEERQQKLKPLLEEFNLEIDRMYDHSTLSKLCWYSFSTDYPKGFLEEILDIND